MVILLFWYIIYHVVSYMYLAIVPLYWLKGAWKIGMLFSSALKHTYHIALYY